MLSLLIKIYEPIIIIANCNLTILISRWYFCEPNEPGFTIFGHLHHLLRFIEVGFIIKITKHFYSQKIKKPKHVSRPTARLGPAAGAAQRRPSGEWQRGRGPARQGGPAAGGRKRAARERGRAMWPASVSGPARQRARQRESDWPRRRCERTDAAAYFNCIQRFIFLHETATKHG